ncbi:MAG: PTS sugar transporter subunit IIA, partial [Lentisphaeria bacterium]|nr:PTS sugar transporter subunit IIA [Lentisphaeria bacterium]
LPHFRIPGITTSEAIIVRTSAGVEMKTDMNFSNEPIHAIFFLVSPADDPSQHLRILAQIATHLDQEGFMHDWKNAPDDHVIKEILLRDDRFVSIEIKPYTTSGEMIGKLIRQVEIPKGCLIALIHRDGKGIVPSGNTELLENDRLTIIGEPDGIHELFHKYVHFEDE